MSPGGRDCPDRFNHADLATNPYHRLLTARPGAHTFAVHGRGNDFHQSTAPAEAHNRQLAIGMGIVSMNASQVSVRPIVIGGRLNRTPTSETGGIVSRRHPRRRPHSFRDRECRTTAEDFAYDRAFYQRSGYGSAMTLHRQGYALRAGESLEDLDFGGGSILSMRVTGEQSNGLLTVIEGVVVNGGPPVHVHQREDEVVVVLEGALTYQVGDEHGVREAGGLLRFPASSPTRGSESFRRTLSVPDDRHPGSIEDFFRAQRDHIASLPTGVPLDPAAFSALPGADLPAP